MAIRILVKAKPGAKKAYIKEEPQGLFAGAAAASAGNNNGGVPARKFTVAVTARAVENRANEAIIAALADHFYVARSSVRIVKGERGKEKIVEIAA